MIEPNKGQKILIVGTGYVGLVTAVGLAKLGHKVSCYDINESKIALLKSGNVPFYERGVSELLNEGVLRGNLAFSSSFGEAFSNQKYIFVAVPTPMGHDGFADLSAVHNAVATIADVVTKETVIIVKSTVPVGVFSDVRQLELGKNQRLIRLVSCPEFLSEGNAVFDFFHPRRTVVGSDDLQISREVAGLLHELPGRFILTDARTAQLIKYSANAFLATRVAFINEVAQLCEALGANVTDVASALLMDPRFGEGYLTAGVGFAGPCLPKDISALIETADRVSVNVPLISSLRDQNFLHLQHVIDTLANELSDGDQVSVFGLAFKPHTDDVRYSFSLKIIDNLIRIGNIHVRATDPQAIPAAQACIASNQVSFWNDPMEAAMETKRQIFLTPWDEYRAIDLDRLGAVVKTKSLFDATGLFDPALVRQKGFHYLGIGRKFDGRSPPLFICE